MLSALWRLITFDWDENDTEDINNDNNVNGGEPQGGDPHPPASSPPLHPRHRFQQLCSRIERNDDALQQLSFQDEIFCVEWFANALARNSTLSDLELIRCLPEEDDFFTLCDKGLQHNNTLKSLTICGEIKQALRCLRTSPMRNSTIRKLALTRCQLGDEGLLELSKSSLGHEGHLVELDLSYNLLSNDELLGNLLQRNSNLEILTVTCNQFTGMGLFHAEDCFGKLVTVDLSCNCIEAEGVAQIAEALGSGDVCRSSLKELRLSGNRLGSDGLVALANGLERSPSLVRVDLERCWLGGGSSLSRLAEALCANERIKEIHLGRNSIGNQGAVTLLEAPTHLRVLDLSCNQIYHGKRLVETFQNCNVILRHLELRHNRVSLRFRNEIQFWTKLNATGGRRLLLRPDAPLALWTMVITRASPDPEIIYFLLRHNPELCRRRSS